MKKLLFTVLLLIICNMHTSQALSHYYNPVNRTLMVFIDSIDMSFQNIKLTDSKIFSMFNSDNDLAYEALRARVSDMRYIYAYPGDENTFVAQISSSIGFINPIVFILGVFIFLGGCIIYKSLNKSTERF